jgi:hypothetical protein
MNDDSTDATLYAFDALLRGQPQSKQIGTLIDKEGSEHKVWQHTFTPPERVLEDLVQHHASPERSMESLSFAGLASVASGTTAVQTSTTQASGTLTLADIDRMFDLMWNEPIRPDIEIVSPWHAEHYEEIHRRAAVQSRRYMQRYRAEKRRVQRVRKLRSRQRRARQRKHCRGTQ